MIRGKFRLDSIKQNCWNNDAREVMFVAHYDNTVPEDQKFAKYTPSAQITMLIDNPSAMAQLTLGDYYYFDISPVAKPEEQKPEQTAS